MTQEAQNKQDNTALQQPKFHIEACPLCGSTEFAKERTCTDFYASGEQFDVCRCSKCGFIFTQDAPDESVVGPYYETKDYISLSDTNEGVMNKVYHAVRNHMLKRKSRLVQQAAGMEKGTILDIGTGTGYFLHTMQQAGWQVEGIEKSAEGRKFSKEHFGLDIHDNDYLSKTDTASKDVITLWHVMEHLQQLNESWQHIARTLKPGGTLVVAVPNCGSADADHYQDYWAAYDTPRHLWHFQPDTMKAFGEKHGFELQKIHPMPFDAFYVSMLSEKYRGKSATFLRGAWQGLLCYFKALGKPQRSSSVIYVFRK